MVLSLSKAVMFECPGEELLWKTYWKTPWSNKELCPPKDAKSGADVYLGPQGAAEVNFWIRVPSFLLPLYSSLSGKPNPNDGDYAWLCLNLDRGASKETIRKNTASVSLGIAAGGETSTLLWFKKAHWLSAGDAIRGSSLYNAFTRQLAVPAPFPDPTPRTYLKSACERIIGLRADVYENTTHPKISYRTLNTQLEIQWERENQTDPFRLVFRRTFGLSGNPSARCFRTPKLDTLGLSPKDAIISLEQRPRSLDKGPTERPWYLRIARPSNTQSATQAKLQAAMLSQAWQELVDTWNSNLKNQASALFYFEPDGTKNQAEDIFSSMPEFDLAVHLNTSGRTVEFNVPKHKNETDTIPRFSRISMRVEPRPPQFVSKLTGRIIFPALRDHLDTPVSATGFLNGATHALKAADESWRESLATKWSANTLRQSEVAWVCAFEIKVCEIDKVKSKPVRAGALDIQVGGKLSDEKNTPCTFLFERNEYFDQLENDDITPLRLTFYALGRKQKDEDSRNSVRALGKTWVADSGEGIEIPVLDVQPGESDHNEAETEILTAEGGESVVEERPLILVVPRAVDQPEDNKFLLELSEIAGATYTRTLELRLKALKGSSRSSLGLGEKNLKVLYVDRAPFFVGMFALNPILDFKREEGNEAAYWSSRGVFRGWQLRATQYDFDLILPPQGVGEAMEKGKNNEGYQDIEEGQPAAFRFPPPSVLTLMSSDLDRRYGTVPWNLRLSMNSLRDDREVGLPLKRAEFEMLYGLQMTIENAPHLRIAEILARIGWPRREFSFNPAEADFYANPNNPKARKPIEIYSDYVEKWARQLAAFNSRLAVYEVFNDRQDDFTSKGEPSELLLEGGGVAHHELVAALRKSARLRVSMAAVPGQESATPLSNLHPFVTTPGTDLDSLYGDVKPKLQEPSWWRGLIPNYDDGLAGSFAWAFESRLLYESLWTDPDPSTPDLVEAAEASLARLYFSALGGWSTQRASFNGGKIIVAVTVEMGRVSELRVEVIGRIGIYWNRAKLVTVFRRSVLPSKQFAEQQDLHAGRPLLRKVEEYVELLEKYRPVKDSATLSVDERLPGCVKAFSCEEKILVDARWGTDIYTAAGQGLGWKVPLRVPGAPKHIYGSANVLLHLHADGAAGADDIPGRIENLENLCFWTDVRESASVDSDTWPSMTGIDIFPPVRGDIGNPAGSEREDPWGTPSVPDVAAQYTFRLAGLDREASLTKHLTPSGVTATDQRPVGSLLRNVTVCRGNTEVSGIEGALPNPVTETNTNAANGAKARLETISGFLEQISRPLDATLESVSGWQAKAGIALGDATQKALDFLTPVVAATQRLTQLRDELKHRIEIEFGWLLGTRASFDTWFSNWSDNFFPEKAKTYEAFQNNWRTEVQMLAKNGFGGLETMVANAQTVQIKVLQDFATNITTASNSLIQKWDDFSGQLDVLYKSTIFGESADAYSRLQGALKVALKTAAQNPTGQTTNESKFARIFTAVLQERLSAQVLSLNLDIARAAKTQEAFQTSIAKILTNALGPASTETAERIAQTLWVGADATKAVSEEEIAAATPAILSILARAPFKQPNLSALEEALESLASYLKDFRTTLEAWSDELDLRVFGLVENIFALPADLKKQIEDELKHYAASRLDLIKSVWLQAVNALGVRSQCFDQASALLKSASDIGQNAQNALDALWGNLDQAIKAAEIAKNTAVQHIQTQLKATLATKAKEIADSIQSSIPLDLSTFPARVFENASFAARRAERYISGLAAEIVEPIKGALDRLDKALTNNAGGLVARECSLIEALATEFFGKSAESYKSLEGTWWSRLGNIDGTLESVNRSFADATKIIANLKKSAEEIATFASNDANKNLIQLRTLVLNRCRDIQAGVSQLSSLCQLPWLNGLPSELNPDSITFALHQFVQKIQSADDNAQISGYCKDFNSDSSDPNSPNFLKALKGLESTLNKQIDGKSLIEKVREALPPSKSAVDQLQTALSKLKLSSGGPSQQDVAAALAELLRFQSKAESIKEDAVRDLVDLVKSLKIFDVAATLTTTRQLLKDALSLDHIPTTLRESEIAKWVDQSRDALGGVLGRITDLGARPSVRESILDVQKAVTTWRAFGQVPSVPSLNFRDMAKLGEIPGLAGLENAVTADVENLNSRIRNVSYIFNNKAETVGKMLRMSSVVTMVDRAKNAAGEAIEDSRLKASTIEMRVREVGEKIDADIARIKDAGKNTLKDLLPDFGGLKLEKLLGAAGLSEETMELFRKKTTITHGFDPQSQSAFVDSKLDNLQLEDSLTVFSFGPVSLRLRNVALFAHLRVETGVGKETTRQSEGVLLADWDVVVGGNSVLTYQQASLRSVNGSVHMELDPRKVRMPSILQSVADAMQGFSYSDDGGLQAGVIANLPTEIIGFAKFNLDIPTAAAGTSGILNLRISLLFELALTFPKFPSLRDAAFRISAGAGLSDENAPFIFSIFILGGCGWFTLRVDYLVPLQDGSPSLAVYISIGLGVSASLALNLGFAQGSVYIALAVEIECLMGKSNPHNRFSMVLTMAGNLSILGIIDVSLLIVLAIRYESPGPMIGEGRIRVRIKICWCFTLKLDRSFTKQFGGDSRTASLPQNSTPIAFAGRDPVLIARQHAQNQTTATKMAPHAVFRKAGRMRI